MLAAPRPARVAADPRPARGRRGEQLAAVLLRLLGYRVLARDVRTPVAQVDLVCRRGATLVVVEVKRRRRHDRGAAVEALGARQAARLVRAATWLHAREAWARDVRVDLVTIDGWRVRVVRDATAALVDVRQV